MGWNDHVDFEQSDHLQGLIDDGLLKKGSPAFGIARQVIETGERGMTDAQRLVYRTEIEPLLRRGL